MFCLIYDADERAGRHAVTLEAEHACELLTLLDSRSVSKPVELWRDGECLGHLKRVNDHGATFWRVSP